MEGNNIFVNQKTGQPLTEEEIKEREKILKKNSETPTFIDPEGRVMTEETRKEEAERSAEIGDLDKNR